MQPTGVPDVVPEDDPYAGLEGRKGALLWTVSTKDGKKTSELPLGARPVSDGLIAAGGMLYLSASDGRVLCLTGQ